ncbi:MAG: 5-bromo-4-chloroindolyl phosphate hydrolysis family protein [Qingshengfaniella sp.]
MAIRYGGKFSPDGSGAPETGPAASAPANPFRNRRRSRVGGRVNALFVLPFPFLIAAFRADPLGLALNLGCFGALILAAWLTRDGIIAEEAYDTRRIARRPAIPRKIFGSALTGIGLALAGVADGSLINMAVFGGLGALLHALSFGIDPLTDKGISEADRFQSDRVARAVTEAESHLTIMTEAITRTRDRALEARVEQFETTARQMFRTVETDPRDLAAARKFLGVYLLGARDATEKFADLYSRNRDPQTRTDYLALLDDLEQNFAAKTEKLLIDDRSDLDVEIGVLRDRLSQEI